MDILYVISTLKTGGSERQLALLASEMAKSGARVTVYSLIDGEVRGVLERAGIRVTIAPIELGRSKLATVLGAPVVALHLLWLMLTRRPAIVHFFLPGAYLIGGPLAVLARLPVRIMSRRSLNTYQRSRFIRGIECLLHRLMHSVLGNSRGVVAQLREEGVPPQRLGLIYNGVVTDDAPVDRDALRAQLGLASATLTLCIVANLIPYKGHRELIDALAIAAPALPHDWRLLVIGRDDGVGQDLKAQAARLGLQAHVDFLGSRSDVTAIMSVSDIGILASHEEGFSNAILEGMAAGLPMVVTDVGGNAEAVVDGETGLVVPARDPSRLAAAFAQLANDPALRARFGAAGRQRVIAHFSVQHFVESHHALYAALRAGQTPADVPDVRVP